MNGHMVQNPPCWRASFAMGHPKQSSIPFLQFPLVVICIFFLMFWFFQPCENIWVQTKNTVTTGKLHFHGNQPMIHLLIPLLLASFKTGLSEYPMVKFCYFLCKEERNSKVSPCKVRTNSVHTCMTFGQFLQLSFLPFIPVVRV